MFPLWDEETGRGFDFESYFLSLTGGEQAYLDAIATIHNDTALEEFISHQTLPAVAALSTGEKVLLFLASSRASKPAVARVAAQKYVAANARAPVPPLFKRVIEAAMHLAAGT